MSRLLLAVGALLFASAYEALAQDDAPRQALYRVNCGATEPYVDRDGHTWSPDQVLAEGADWGATGGGTVTREEALPIQGATGAAEVCRTERYGIEAYEFVVPAGYCAVRLHFAETFDGHYRAGLRRFSVDVNGQLALTGFDPYKEAGGFARPVVMEVTGVATPDGRLHISFTPEEQSTLVNGIEVFASGPAEFGVRRLTEPGPGALPEGYDGRPALPGALRVLFIGNSHTMFWAIPETVERMVNDGRAGMTVRCDRAVQGGAGIGWHLANSDVAERIARERYALVVFQGVYAPEDQEAVRTLDKAVRAAGGRSLIYVTWRTRSGPPFNDDPQVRLSAEVAEQLGVQIVPVGQAWEAAWARRPGMVLIGPDGLHSGLLGSYLTASVFYAALTGRSPEDNTAPAALVGQVPMPQRTADFLEKIAWQTAQRFGVGVLPGGEPQGGR